MNMMLQPPRSNTIGSSTSLANRCTLLGIASGAVAIRLVNFLGIFVQYGLAVDLGGCSGETLYTVSWEINQSAGTNTYVLGSPLLIC